MDAVLFVGHGSRDPEGNGELLRFTGRVAEHLSMPIIETCFLELAEPGIPRGIARCAERGARRILVVPVMLFFAGHVKIHIPLAIREAAERYPEIAFAYGRPVGVEEEVLPILERRIRSVIPSVKGRDRRETAVLLVGRGSSDAEANGDLYKIARLLWERVPIRWVEVAFIGVTDPRLDEGVERCVRLGSRNIVILPYFLFTGVLIKRMREKMEEFHLRYPGVSVSMAPYLGLDEGLIDIFLRRVRETKQGEGLPWRFLAERAIAEGQHHHHDHHHDHAH